MSWTRLIVPGEKNINDEGNVAESPGIAYTEEDKVHHLLFERNVKHFSLAGKTPQGINWFICEALGPYDTSKFSDRVLERQMTKDNKEGFSLIEVEEIFLATSHPDPQLPPEK